jgi:hypothetical protein
VSDYGLDDRAIEVRSPAEAKDFSSILCVQTGSAAHPIFPDKMKLISVFMVQMKRRNIKSVVIVLLKACLEALNTTRLLLTS